MFRQNSQQLNIWNIGDTGTFGKKPNIDLKDAFFGYFSDIDDPYPNINGLTKVNLSYLIDEQGNALPPTLEDQLSIDTYNSVFPPTTQARLAARDGKDQFKQLGKPSNIKKIFRKRPSLSSAYDTIYIYILDFIYTVVSVYKDR